MFFQSHFPPLFWILICMRDKVHLRGEKWSRSETSYFFCHTGWTFAMTKGLKEDFMKAKAVTHISTVALKTWNHDTLPFHDQSFHDCYVYQKCTKYRDKWTKCVTNYKAKKWKNVMGARSSLSAADHGPHLSITVPRVPFNHPQWRLPEKYFQWGWKFHFETYQNIPIQNNCAQSAF